MQDNPIGPREFPLISPKIHATISLLFEFIVAFFIERLYMAVQSSDLAKFIRAIPDWPKPGILFRDITPLLADHDAYLSAVEALVADYKSEQIDYVAAVEARGFIFGSAVAERLQAGFIPVRKHGKLPYKTESFTYDLEYGTDTIEMHKDSFDNGESKVLLIDDLLATGGTALAGANLIKKLGGTVAEAAFIVNLPDLGGEKKLKENGISVHCLTEFEGE